MPTKKQPASASHRQKATSRKKTATAPRVLPDAADQVRPTAGLSREEMPDRGDRNTYSHLFDGCIDRGQPLTRK